MRFEWLTSLSFGLLKWEPDESESKFSPSLFCWEVNDLCVLMILCVITLFCVLNLWFNFELWVKVSLQIMSFFKSYPATVNALKKPELFKKSLRDFNERVVALKRSLHLLLQIYESSISAPRNVNWYVGIWNSSDVTLIFSRIEYCHI